MTPGHSWGDPGGGLVGPNDGGADGDNPADIGNLGPANVLLDWDYSHAGIDEHVAWGSYKVWPDAAAAKLTSNGCMSGRLRRDLSRQGHRHL
ncbi:hypothetical protein [Streptomyces sp. NPDC059957]|uniref:hypothetical protein n=1 Tax=Streptomyces sp. NPDC059957 TaxID=3347016 RepID=UPI003649091B